MSVILAADGQTWARQEEILLTGEEMRWFIDGPALLRHTGSLQRIRARLHCCRCQQRPTVRVIEGNRAEFTCCRRGVVDLNRPSEVVLLLQCLWWAFACDRCGEPLSGDNDPQGLVFDVRCPCTRRVYHRPALGLVS